MSSGESQSSYESVMMDMTCNGIEMFIPSGASKANLIAANGVSKEATNAFKKHNDVLTSNNTLGIENVNPVLVNKTNSQNVQNNSSILKRLIAPRAGMKKSLMAKRGAEGSDKKAALVNINKTLEAKNGTLCNENAKLTVDMETLTNEKTRLLTEKEGLVVNNEVLMETNKNLSNDKANLLVEIEALSDEKKRLIAENKAIASKENRAQTELFYSKILADGYEKKQVKKQDQLNKIKTLLEHHETATENLKARANYGPIEEVQLVNATLLGISECAKDPTVKVTDHAKAIDLKAESLILKLDSQDDGKDTAHIEAVSGSDGTGSSLMFGALTMLFVLFDVLGWSCA